MKRVMYLLVLALILNSPILAQYTPFEKAQLIDEFGILTGTCDPGARIDNVFANLQNNPNDMAIVVYYRGANEPPGKLKSTPRTLALMQDYIRMRNFDTSRVRIVDGGFRNLQTYRIWIVPLGAVAPLPSDTVPEPKIPKNETFLWDSSFLDWEAYYSDDVIGNQDEADVIFPGMWIKHSFAKYLGDNKELTGFIFYYADGESLSLDQIKKEIERGRSKMEKEGLGSGRIIVAYGGYKPFELVEFWIKSRNSPFPVAKPEELPVNKDDSKNYE